jgi:hypothetical protein
MEKQMQDEREAFEAWAKPLFFDLLRMNVDDYHNLITQAAWMAWQARAALPAAQPGYKLVPIEPTMAMSTAFHSARPQTAVEEPDGSWSANAWGCFRASYAAMLAASGVPASSNDQSKDTK